MSIEDILKLPPLDRLQMVEQIWDSLEPIDIRVPQSQKDELDNRIDIDVKGEMSWHSVDDVKTLFRNKK